MHFARKKHTKVINYKELFKYTTFCLLEQVGRVDKNKQKENGKNLSYNH